MTGPLTGPLGGPILLIAVASAGGYCAGRVVRRRVGAHSAAIDGQHAAMALGMVAMLTLDLPVAARVALGAAYAVGGVWCAVRLWSVRRESLGSWRLAGSAYPRTGIASLGMTAMLLLPAPGWGGGMSRMSGTGMSGSGTGVWPGFLALLGALVLGTLAARQAAAADATWTCRTAGVCEAVLTGATAAMLLGLV